jgi:hypothetical protein
MLEQAASGHVLQAMRLGGLKMTPGDSETSRPDWRFFAALVVGLVIIVIVATAMFRWDQRSATLNSASGVVNGKPVANSTASD